MRALHINSQALCGSLDVVLMRGGVVVALWGFAASTSVSLQYWMMVLCLLVFVDQDLRMVVCVCVCVFLQWIEFFLFSFFFLGDDVGWLDGVTLWSCVSLGQLGTSHEY